MAVSLFAVAVVATGLVLARQKEQKPAAEEEVRPGDDRPVDERPAEFSLDAIRAAGL